jgi:hypothetical protein
MVLIVLIVVLIVRMGSGLKRFRAKWMPVRVKKTRQIKTQELCF